MRASDTLPASPHYLQAEVRAGLKRLGYEISPPRQIPDPGDVLVIWNRNRTDIPLADRYERRGATVVVIENGYIGHDAEGRQLFAMAKRFHAGAGVWTVGDEDRWKPLDLPILPWRYGGDEIVVLPQRGIGPPGIAMPARWAEDVVGRLKKVTDRPIRIRPHPGRNKLDPTPDLKRAHCAVTWASSAGIKALLFGVPMFYEMPTWIGGPASEFGISGVNWPIRHDRLPMLKRLCWAQWRVSEIQSGEAFRWLLG